MSVIYQYLAALDHIESASKKDEAVAECLKSVLKIDKACSVGDYLILEYDRLYQ